MNLIIKKASSFSTEELAALGLTGIPADWPVYVYPYVNEIPIGYEQVSDAEYTTLKSTNQEAYDAWVASKRPEPTKNPAQEVVTQAEKPDKSLVLASIECDFSGNEAVAEIKIPGELGTFGRYVAGGYGFTDVYGWGDRISKVEIVDKDFVFAGTSYPATPFEAGVEGATEEMTWADVMPGGVVLGGYHDAEVGEENRGWRLWCDDGNQGGVDIDPLGGYGRLPALAYLRITFKKAANSSAAHAAVNLWWGKQESDV